MYSPFLPHKADVELAALQVFTRVAHDLVECIFQQMVTTNDQPETQSCTHVNAINRNAVLSSIEYITITLVSLVLGRSL